MKLTEKIHSKEQWSIEEHAYDAEHVDHSPSIFLCGNGYMGYRGTFSDQRAEDLSGWIISNTWDNADGRWSELVNAPNPLYLSIERNGIPFDWRASKTPSYRRGLDFFCGRWYTHNNDEFLDVEQQRMASMDDLHLLTAQTTIDAKQEGELSITWGIDEKVWNLNGEHFKEVNFFQDGPQLVARLKTQQSKIKIEIRLLTYFTINQDRLIDTKLINNENKADGMFHFNLFLQENDRLEVESYAVIHTSRDCNGSWAEIAALNRKSIDAAAKARWENLLERSAQKWGELWQKSQIKIDGDDKSDLLVRYNTYQALICTPMHSERLPIGARGLSCQAYQGAAFWDQEVYNLPMYIHTMPTIAKNIVRYRYNTLDGARAKAKNLGYRGAFYAWVSSDTGEEICPSYFFVDVLSGRPIRSHFNDWQIHISADVAWALHYYITNTGDDEILDGWGAEMLFEIVRFYVSRAHADFDGRVAHLIRVLGPDEYHEGVDDNYYTNALVSDICRWAASVWDERPKARSVATAIGMDENEMNLIRELGETLQTPLFNEMGVIEQFTGYFDLEDTTADVLTSRLIRPDEYWGYPHGVAVQTQVTKQADVLQYFVLNPSAVDKETQTVNFHYYEKRTQHGSSLSPAVHAIIGSRVAETESAFEYFLHATMIDIENTNKAVSGGTFIGGIHTAACAAAWQIVIKGFCGLETDASSIEFTPQLPSAWKTLSFSLVHQGRSLSIALSNTTLHIKSLDHNEGDLTIRFNGQQQQLPSSESLSFE